MARLYKQTFAINQKLDIRNNNKIFEILLRKYKTFHCECIKLKMTVKIINDFVDDEKKLKVPKRICPDHKLKWSRGKIFEA